MGLVSRARQNWSKNRKCPQFASLSQPNPLLESKNCFLNWIKKFSRICRGFEQLSSYCGWRVIAKNPRAAIVALVGGKGLLCRPRESIQSGSLWKALGSVACVRCWPPPVIAWSSSNCIPAQKFVSASGELNHDRSPLMLDSDKGVCGHRSFP